MLKLSSETKCLNIYKYSRLILKGINQAKQKENVQFPTPNP